jgi:hypothetical protein
VRRVEIIARFLGAHHDGSFDLTYKNVSSYSLTLKDMSANRGHGDWMIDELTLHDPSKVQHEIELSGATINICCTDVHYRWRSKRA